VRSSRDAQVCRQIRDRLDLVLCGELGDPSLEGLAVLDVRPVAGLSAVCVRVAAPSGASLAQIQLAQARLGAIAGRLRCEAAAAIHRKRTPALRFEVVPTPQ
jgi:ribosome-binding factor A